MGNDKTEKTKRYKKRKKERENLNKIKETQKKEKILPVSAQVALHVNCIRNNKIIRSYKNGRIVQQRP